MPSIRPALLAAAFALAAGVAAPAGAAESYDNCTGFIDSLPATISTQGVWCLRQNLSTALTSGTAITVATNNVTIDCNDFKLGGLAAGDASQAYGIAGTSVMNPTVRRCGIRGFERGIQFINTSGALVEDNRLDGILRWAVRFSIGSDNRVHRNRIFDTGGSTLSTSAAGITGADDVVDNVVSGIMADTGGDAIGILGGASGARVSGNRVAGLTGEEGAAIFGIYATGQGAVISGNQVYVPGGTQGITAGLGSMCSNNNVHGAAVAYIGCDQSAGNLETP